ncbi:serine/threonine-protein kinase [Kitasatospora sp. NPDC018058]|uniref:serine/threonine-protein kinase n=1 Tax=Kitasatospora sp. NPDC018058 TaxID=3364025 RepID=UPI0037BEE739
MVDGRTLAEVIAADGPLPPREAARVGTQILAALVRGHRSGLVHGAVEPGRVVLERGRAVLGAFAAGPSDASPEYRAPERLAGRPPGPEADLWSLGATLYTAVEGRPPAEQPPAPRRAGPLAPVIQSLLRTDPAQRPGAEWTGHMLDRVAAGLTVGPATAEALPSREPTAAASTPLPGEPPPAARRPGALIAAVVLALALIGGLVFLLAGRGTQHRATITAPATPPSATAPPTPETPTTPPPTPETPSPQPPSTAPPQTPGAAVPPGYVETNDPAGFSFAAPTGWTRTDNGMGAGDYSPDNGGHVLRFTLIANPSKQAPVDGFRQLEQSLTQQGGYTRIDLRADTYQGNPAASWEFTFGPTHVGAQSFLAPNGTEYTVYLSTPDSDWASYQPVLTTALSTFTIP